MPPSERLDAAAAADGEQRWGRWDSLKALSTRTLDELLGGLEDGDAWHRVPRGQRVPPMEAAVEELRHQAMLPAIWFIFSRKECDASVARLHAAGVRLTTDSGTAVFFFHT